MSLAALLADSAEFPLPEKLPHATHNVAAASMTILFEPLAIFDLHVPVNSAPKFKFAYGHNWPDGQQRVQLPQSLVSQHF